MVKFSTQTLVALFAMMLFASSLNAQQFSQGNPSYTDSKDDIPGTAGLIYTPTPRYPPPGEDHTGWVVHKTIGSLPAHVVVPQMHTYDSPSMAWLIGRTLPCTEIGDFSVISTTQPTLKTLSLPETIERVAYENVGEWTAYFYGQVNFEQFILRGNNPFLELCEEGVLYSKGFETLLFCPPARQIGASYHVKPNTELIQAYAFGLNQQATEIVIPNSVKHVGSTAFFGAPNLRKIVFGTGLESMNAGLFNQTRNLELYFYSTTPPTIYMPHDFAGVGGTFAGSNNSDIATQEWGSSIKAIYVPAGTVDAYVAAWSHWATSTLMTFIKEMPGSTTYAINVTGATADKTEAAQGELITLTLNVPEGKEFDRWTTTIGIQASNIMKINETTHSFIMPGNAVTLVAGYKDIPPPPAITFGEVAGLWKGSYEKDASTTYHWAIDIPTDGAITGTVTLNAGSPASFTATGISINGMVLNLTASALGHTPAFGMTYDRSNKTFTVTTITGSTETMNTGVVLKREAICTDFIEMEGTWKATFKVWQWTLNVTAAGVITGTVVENAMHSWDVNTSNVILNCDTLTMNTEVLGNYFTYLVMAYRPSRGFTVTALDGASQMIDVGTVFRKEGIVYPPEYCTVNIVQSPYGTITVMHNSTPISDGTILPEDAVLSLTATPNPGYTFTKWWDGNTNATRNFTLKSDVVISAVFEEVATYQKVSGGIWEFNYYDVVELRYILYKMRFYNDGMTNLVALNDGTTFRISGAFPSTIDGSTITIPTSGAPAGDFRVKLEEGKLSLIYVPGAHVIPNVQGTFTQDGATSVSFADVGGGVWTFNRTSPNMEYNARFLANDSVELTMLWDGMPSGAGTFKYHILGNAITFMTSTYPNQWQTSFYFVYDGNDLLLTQIQGAPPFVPYPSIRGEFTSDEVTYHTVNIITPTNGTITVMNGDTQVNDGDVLERRTVLSMTATPDSGYEFDKWWDGFTTASREFTLTSDLTISATFKNIVIPPVKYTVTITPATNGTITVMDGTTEVSTGDQLEEGTVLTLTATPDANYEFLTWWDGDTLTTRTYTLTEDVTISATFQYLSVIQIATDKNSLTVFPNPVSDVLHIQTNQRIQQIVVTDLQGKTIMMLQGDCKTVDLKSVPTGNYFVRIHTETTIIPVKIIKQ